MRWWKTGSILWLSAIAACGPRTTNVVEAQVRSDTARVLERFQAYRLEPAQIAPPTLENTSKLTSIPGISASAEIVRAENADWNQWPGTTSRLFNNRAALLFELEVTSDVPVRWQPERTRLELNREGNILRAAETQEVLLEDLLFWAYHQERNVLDGDLALRARAAGPFREAYMPASADRLLNGVIAFPLVTTPENERFFEGLDPSDYHVVSMRLTVGVEEATGDQSELVWLFE